MHQFRQEMGAGFKAIEERLVAIEAAATARGAERAKSAAKGVDFEDLLAVDARRHRPRRRGPARPDRDRDRRRHEVQEGRFRADPRRAGRARLRSAGRRRGQGSAAVHAGHPGRTARGAGRTAGRPSALIVFTPAHAPAGVAPFAVFGDDVYCVIDPDAPEPATLEAAVKLARLLALASLAEHEVEVDAAAIAAALTAVREQLELVRTLKSQLTSISNATKAVWTGLDTMRSNILARVADAEAEIRAVDVA